ncbi:transposable element P transposase [Trichonephila clavipes]|nr:transposable element P transposase [Trichonephila clavipes]
MDDDRLTFFSKFVQWLDCWKNLKQNKREGCLSEETFFALRHTVNTIPELIKYLLTEQNFKYVLTGKFQTDRLEARFGQYRQMSGANYHVTVQEILQSENKLRIKMPVYHLGAGTQGPDKLDLTRFSGYKFKSSNAKVASRSSAPRSQNELKSALHRRRPGTACQQERTKKGA